MPISRAEAQDRLPTMPGYEQYSQVGTKYQQAQQLLSEGSIFANWIEDGKAFEFNRAGKKYRYDIASNVTTEVSPPAPEQSTSPGRRPPRRERGRQFTTADSPDKKQRALYRDNNVWLGDVEGNNAVAVTTDGNSEKRIKYGTGSWVYGEELDQTTAMWWSPDSKKLAFYRFDESQAKEYYLALDQLKTQTTLDAERYPKAGAPNPVVDIFIYDTETKKTVQLDVREGKPFTDDTLGYYVYDVRWSPDGKELLFNRANRKQNRVDFTASDPETGRCRTIESEQNPNGWVSEHPGITFLPDGKRFLLLSDRNGFRNIYLYDLSGKLLNTVTQHPFDVQGIVRVDDKAGVVYYTAQSGDTTYKRQLHRVELSGKKDIRLTDPAFHHSITLSPDGKLFLDIAQSHAVPPTTRLCSIDGKVLSTVAKTDTEKLKEVGFAPGEVFTFKAADGKTDLYGKLFRPSNFDPTRKYPLLVQVYAGPDTTGASETYDLPTPITELGFLVARLDARGGSNRGRAFKDAMYGKMGTVEIDDQAAGVKFLRQRPYVDGSRVGIEGTSYGGYASAMALLRHPDVFQAACASSSVTDWRNYDTIYTERYMGLPQENKTGYDTGSAMTYAPNLKGRLMLYYGTADNNVHPANTLQLIAALQKAGKSFDLQVGPDQGHTSLNTARMMEFFIDNLVLRPTAPLSTASSK